MLRIKRLYTFMLQTFLPLFVMTFGICLFIVLMQFLWRYIDDLVGKGLGVSVLSEMLLYAAMSLIPMALPLSILLASLMTFGNLGERLELLAMKSAGVSLIHIMRPLIVLIAFVSVGAFFFQNNAMPKINVKFYSLLQSIKQKNPELDIAQGSFNTEIPGYNVYVKKKDNKTGLLEDVTIYDYKDGFNNARVFIADSARLKTSADKLFLVLTLFDGESFENVNPQSSSKGLKAVAYRRETFGSKEVLIEFDANLMRADESEMQGTFVGKKLNDLQTSIDSLSIRLDSIRMLNVENIMSTSYKRTLRDNNASIVKEENLKKVDSESLILNFDSVYLEQSPSSKAALLARVKSTIENVSSDNMFRAQSVGAQAKTIRRHEIEWHKKFTFPFSCLVFFFIGAPLGAIIRKGGLGVPVIISVLLYIFYYIIDNIGFKMARDSVWFSWQGMWLSSAVLTPMGVFLTYKAVKDSVILNADTYMNIIKNLFGKRSNRKVEMKEVIIFSPDYAAVAVRLEALIVSANEYINNHKRWVNYFSFWRQGGRDPLVEQLSDEVESIVEELADSDKILIINKLMDYPVMSGYNQLKVKMSPSVGLIISFLFPIGLPFYLLATYKRKLLNRDVKVVKRTSEELLDMMRVD